jgi:hypothetical protein
MIRGVRHGPGGQLALDLLPVGNGPDVRLPDGRGAHFVDCVTLLDPRVRALLAAEGWEEVADETGVLTGVHLWAHGCAQGAHPRTADASTPPHHTEERMPHG